MLRCHLLHYTATQQTHNPYHLPSSFYPRFGYTVNSTDGLAWLRLTCFNMVRTPTPKPLPPPQEQPPPPQQQLHFGIRCLALLEGRAGRMTPASSRSTAPQALQHGACFKALVLFVCNVQKLWVSDEGCCGCWANSCFPPEAKAFDMLPFPLPHPSETCFSTNTCVFSLSVLLTDTTCLGLFSTGWTHPWCCCSKKAEALLTQNKMVNGPRFSVR